MPDFLIINETQFPLQLSLYEHSSHPPRIVEATGNACEEDQEIPSLITIGVMLRITEDESEYLLEPARRNCTALSSFIGDAMSIAAATIMAVSSAGFALLHFTPVTFLSLAGACPASIGSGAGSVPAAASLVAAFELFAGGNQQEIDGIVEDEIISRAHEASSVPILTTSATTIEELSLQNQAIALALLNLSNNFDCNTSIWIKTSGEDADSSSEPATVYEILRIFRGCYESMEVFYSRKSSVSYRVTGGPVVEETLNGAALVIIDLPLEIELSTQV